MAAVVTEGRSTSGTAFGIGPRVRAAFATHPHDRAPGEPVWRPLRVLAVDPTVRRSEGAIATLRVPYEPLQPGPAGALFVVDPHDDAANVDYQRVDLDRPAVLIDNGVATSPGNPQFHQQMVYGVASAVYASFRGALGRNPAFAVPADATGRARLRLRPHAAPGLNAWYDRHRGEIAFGYAPGPDGFVFTCLSHDVVAHEVTHALVDGLRSRFESPTNPDVPAFHEALADLVALFHRFTYPEVVCAAMRSSRGDLREARALTELARQVGEAYRWPALRQALDADPDHPRLYDPSLEAHALGGVLVAAVFDAFLAVFKRKTARHVRLATSGTGVLPPGDPPIDLQHAMAEEASGLARQFLAICIRAIDYCPPVDIEFGEFLRAVITADRDLVPDDPWDYREAWIESFRRHRIQPQSVATLSEDALVWSPPDRDVRRVEALSFSALRCAGDPGHAADADELERQAREIGGLVTSANCLPLFGLLDPAQPHDGLVPERPVVESVRVLRRVGPDGQVRVELVAEVTQDVSVSTSDAPVRLCGGSTVLIGPDGVVRLVVRKGLTNADRRQRQVAFVKGM
ncbi:MAG: peptidase M4 [Vicinamibacteria bacterium]|nr:peptidase M4 [Vicinamibacteria bacterium]